MDGRIVSHFIQTIAQMGFEGPEVEKQVWERVNSGLDSFSITCKKEYDQERMDYELFIEKNSDVSETLHLMYLIATHRKPIEIAEKVINGVNTGSLDKEMALVDWQSYWYDNKESLAPSQEKQVSGIMKALTKLHASGEIPGLEFQQLLMYKHWPEEYFDVYRKSERHLIKNKYEESEKFILLEFPLVTADLAYHILSDRYEALISKLQSLGFNRIPEINMDIILQKMLSHNPDNFLFEGTYNTAEGFVAFGIPIKKVDGWYNFDTYQITFTPYPEADHGIFNGIDTAVLESSMQEVSWNNPKKLFIYHEESEPEFRPLAYDLVEELNRLKQTKEGAEVAAILELKYLRGVVFYGDHLSDRAWELLEQFPQRTNNFPAEQNINSAVNAMAGHAVLNTLNKKINKEMDCWVRLDFSQRQPDGTYVSRLIEGYSVQQVEDHIRMLPIFNHCFYDIRDELLAGDKVRTPLLDDREIIIQALPEEETLRLYTPDMQPIPFNFRMEPNRLSEHRTKLKQEPLTQTDKVQRGFKVNYSYKKGKGI